MEFCLKNLSNFVIYATLYRKPTNLLVRTFLGLRRPILMGIILLEIVASTKGDAAFPLKKALHMYTAALKFAL